MSGQHTVGPWSVDERGDIVSGPFNIAILLACKPEDRLLIASAPQLLSASRAALNFIENTESELGIELATGHTLRAAIAAATGGAA
jgi:hypothetical protein